MANSLELIGTEKESYRNYCAKRMSVTQEFIRLFDFVLFRASIDGKEISDRQACDALNELYFNMTGTYRYKSFERFLNMRKRSEQNSFPSQRRNISIPNTQQCRANG